MNEQYKFLVVMTREDRPVADEEPRFVEAHGYTPEELSDFLATRDHFEIGGRRFEVVGMSPSQLRFTMKLAKP